jgi:uncharacterized membrane protein
MTTGRLEAFSDGVFAIAITLLVLGIAVPPPGTTLGAELLRLWPSFLTYVVSFLLIGAIWINHHAIFRHIVRADGTLLVLNLLQLMVFAFLPFPTAVLAGAFLRGTDEGIAVTLYGGTLVVGALFVNAVWQYAARGHLLGTHLTTGEARQLGRRYLVGLLLYAVGTVVGLVLPWLALLLYVFINAFYLWPGGIDEVTLAGTTDPEQEPEGRPPPLASPKETRR